MLIDKYFMICDKMVWITSFEIEALKPIMGHNDPDTNMLKISENIFST